MWHQGKQHGWGTMVWTEGHKYVGYFRQDMRWGLGKQTYAEGSSFEDYAGYWKKDREMPNKDVQQQVKRKKQVKIQSRQVDCP